MYCVGSNWLLKCASMKQSEFTLFHLSSIQNGSFRSKLCPQPKAAPITVAQHFIFFFLATLLTSLSSIQNDAFLVQTPLTVHNHSHSSWSTVIFISSWLYFCLTYLSSIQNESLTMTISLTIDFLINCYWIGFLNLHIAEII